MSEQVKEAQTKWLITRLQFAKGEIMTGDVVNVFFAMMRPAWGSTQKTRDRITPWMKEVYQDYCGQPRKYDPAAYPLLDSSVSNCFEIYHKTQKADSSLLFNYFFLLVFAMFSHISLA